jgi:uncharacterized Zn finger protein
MKQTVVKCDRCGRLKPDGDVRWRSIVVYGYKPMVVCSGCVEVVAEAIGLEKNIDGALMARDGKSLYEKLKGMEDDLDTIIEQQLETDIKVSRIADALQKAKEEV